ncbi:TetR family transcriptional regulator [Lichenihabitans sp. Uapishka_5]|uniref:TetR family transcriptional regulator n=1 Tax=Lichenihabitans sp. Uapishka_5 TaxID=3037302 RepID=UPI0029E8148E|nr:TetR family transcriptional regulator [Lichenihabitans sp. Uapishka_5]MDX7951769.1 TetR family transcriptional regulator [Lichenihabitans sp. Uapishka_5]
MPSDKPLISQRKKPKQARSSCLVTAILDAAAQVLAQEGAHRFTTARVAERAGVSIGSLYQYFPNKAAILFRLQSEEWQETSTMMRDILADAGQLPLDRLRALVHAFLSSECQEAKMRIALSDAAPLYRDAPEAQSKRAEGDAMFSDFIEEVLPVSSAATRVLAADLVLNTMGEVGKSFSDGERSVEEIAAYADAMADMFCAYLTQIEA